MHAICSVDAPNAFGASFRHIAVLVVGIFCSGCTSIHKIRSTCIGGSRGCILYFGQLVAIVGIGQVIHKAVRGTADLTVALFSLCVTLVRRAGWLYSFLYKKILAAITARSYYFNKNVN